MTRRRVFADITSTSYTELSRATFGYRKKFWMPVSRRERHFIALELWNGRACLPKAASDKAQFRSTELNRLRPVLPAGCQAGRNLIYFP